MDATKNWHAEARDMSGAYIHHKHCRQRTELVLGGAPSVAAAKPSSFSRVRRVRPRASLRLELWRVAPVAHLDHYSNDVKWARLRVHRQHVRHMDEHGLVVLMACLLVDKARALALDLHTSTCFLLDVLDKHTLIHSVSYGTTST